MLNQQTQNELIEQTWQELGGKVPRSHIQAITAEVSKRFADATITAYVPLLVRRLTQETLQQELVKTKTEQ